FGQWVESDEIAHRDSQRVAIGAGGAVGIQAQLDVVPADRQSVDGGVEGVSRSHQRQYAATDNAVVGEQADTTALGEAARPATDRCQAQAAVVLDLADDGTNGVEMRGNRAVKAFVLALAPAQRGADGAAAGQFEGDFQLFEAFGDVAHDGVGETGRAGDGEHLQQDLLQVIQIGFG